MRTLELSVPAKYAFALAQRFNGFYHSSPMVAEDDESTRPCAQRASLGSRRR